MKNNFHVATRRCIFNLPCFTQVMAILAMSPVLAAEGISQNCVNEDVHIRAGYQTTWSNYEEVYRLHIVERELTLTLLSKRNFADKDISDLYEIVQRKREGREKSAPEFGFRQYDQALLNPKEPIIAIVPQFYQENGIFLVKKDNPKKKILHISIDGMVEDVTWSLNGRCLFILENKHVRWSKSPLGLLGSFAGHPLPVENLNFYSYEIANGHLSKTTLVEKRYYITGAFIN